MKSFRFLWAISTLLLLASCGPGEGTGGRTGDYDRHNKLVDDEDDDKRDRDRHEDYDTNHVND